VKKRIETSFSSQFLFNNNIKNQAKGKNGANSPLPQRKRLCGNQAAAIFHFSVMVFMEVMAKSNGRELEFHPAKPFSDDSLVPAVFTLIYFFLPAVLVPFNRLFCFAL
jgi:hypothetical protein